MELWLVIVVFAVQVGLIWMLRWDNMVLKESLKELSRELGWAQEDIVDLKRSLAPKDRPIYGLSTATDYSRMGTYTAGTVTIEDQKRFGNYGT